MAAFIKYVVNGEVLTHKCADKGFLLGEIASIKRRGGRILEQRGFDDDDLEAMASNVSLLPVCNNDSSVSPLRLPTMKFPTNNFSRDSSGNDYLDTVGMSIPQQASAGKWAEFEAALLSFIRQYDWSESPQDDSSDQQDDFGQGQHMTRDLGLNASNVGGLPLPSMTFDPPPSKNHRQRSTSSPQGLALPVMNFKE